MDTKTLDLMLGDDWDLAITETGDIQTTWSIRQSVILHLRWISEEWRLGPDFGFPWFEYVFVKNPNVVRIRQLIRDEVQSVDGVKSAKVTLKKFNKAKREISFYVDVDVGEDNFREELTLYG